jgi:hypothetical protein
MRSYDAVRSTLTLATVVALACLISLDAAVAQSDKRVTICHVPPGNPSNQHTISVGEPAVSAHLAHGDALGPCSAGCGSDPSVCDDRDACTSDFCTEDGQCGHEFVSCDDDNACTLDWCDALVGCVALPTEGAPCDDGNACTSGDACIGPICQGEPTPDCCGLHSDCDDGDDCTTDRCIEGSCANDPLDCAVEDMCFAGFCVDGNCSAAPVSCDDQDFCTDDGCDPATGCTNTPTTSPPETVEVSCADGLDNDCDGAIDALDLDCQR